jgi:hypothetical protein
VSGDENAMTTTTDYRRQAEQCLELARQTTAPHHRASLLQIAETWMTLAAERERDLPSSQLTATADQAS